MVTQAEIDRAADLAREFGLTSLSSAGHEKLAMLLAAYAEKTVKRRHGPLRHEPPTDRERAKAPPDLVEIVKIDRPWWLG